MRLNSISFSQFSLLVLVPFSYDEDYQFWFFLRNVCIWEPILRGKVFYGWVKFYLIQAASVLIRNISWSLRTFPTNNAHGFYDWLRFQSELSSHNILLRVHLHEILHVCTRELSCIGFIFHFVNNPLRFPIDQNLTILEVLWHLKHFEKLSYRQEWMKT